MGASEPSADIAIPMNAKQYRDALEKRGMSQLAAGELFGVGARASRRWALDEARVPAAVAMLLRLMLDKRLKLEVPIGSGRRPTSPDAEAWDS